VKCIATIVDDKIATRNEFDDPRNDWMEASELSKAVGGGRWHKESKTWRYPLSLDTCHRLRTIWGKRLVVAEPLRQWYRATSQKGAARASAAHQADATLTRLPTVAPLLMATLRADQRVTAQWLSEGWRGAGLLADHPGTGKTMSTIAAILEQDVPGPVLVVCPRLSVRSVWLRELTRWTDERVYIARGTRRQRDKAMQEFDADPARRKWLVVVAETLRIIEEFDEEELGDLAAKKKFAGYEYPFLFEVLWSTVIVDESHKMFGSLTVVKGNLAGKGLKRLNIASGEGIHRIAISGTPFGRGGRVQGMFGTLHWLWPDEFTAFWRWAGIHFEVTEEETHVGGGRTRAVKKVGPLKGGKDEEHFLATLGPRILRRTKAEVLPNLPEKRRVDVWCEPTPAMRKQYARLVDDGEIVGKSGMLTVDGVLAFITRGKQLANGLVDVQGEKVVFTPESCKIEMVMQKLEEAGISKGEKTGDRKVIIASQFNEMLFAIEKVLQANDIKYFKIVGGTSDRERDKAMDQFQSAQMTTRVFLLNSKAGGVSVTLDAADDMHMLDTMWDPGDNEQLEDRIHRASRVHQATIYRYLTEGTIDESIANDVEGRRFQQYRVLDQARDVTYARALVEGK